VTTVKALTSTGRYLIDTERDTYDVDIDARIAIWHDLATEAAGQHVNPEPFLFDTIKCTVGEPMLFDADTPFTRATPRVLGITPIPVEVPA